MTQTPDLAPHEPALPLHAPGERPQGGPQQGRIRRQARCGPLPLSFAQQQFWLLYQLAPDSVAHQHQISLCLPPTLDVAALQQSLEAVIRRHEAWRTSFPLVDGQPVQRIHSPSEFHLLVTDLSQLSAEAQEAEMQRLRADLGRPFDLAAAPPLRMHLICLGERGYRLLVCLHHILYDGHALWQIFLPELLALYQAFASGQPAPLPAPDLHYADYALWQRETLDERALAAHLAYWQEHLAGIPAELPLPTDYARPPAARHRVARAGFTLPSPIRDALGALSMQEGATLFMTGLAAFATLLSRYTGARDVVIGTPATLRRQPELETLLGVCINTLALRIDTDGDPSFRSLLRRVRQTTLAGLDHADLPFEEVVKALHPQRALGRNPLFQMILTFEEAPPALPVGWALDEQASPSDTAAVDLRLALTERSGELAGYMEYDPDLFAAATIERLVRNFQTLLVGICRDPDQPLSALPLLSEAEHHQVLVEWNATQTPYPRDQPIHRLFEAQVDRRPEAIALIEAPQHLTYQDLNQRANQLAHALRALRVGPGALVGVMLPRSFDLIVALLGILKAGGAYVPLDPTYPAERLTFMLEDTHAPVLLTTQPFLNLLPTPGLRVICLDRDWPAISAESTENLSEGATAEDRAYVMYTSGSTGKPKGVEILHRNIARLVFGTTYARLDETRTILHLAPIAFDGSTFEVWGALLHGARCVLFPDQIPTPERLGAVIREQQVTTLWLTAALFNTVIDADPATLAPVEQVLAGGEALSVAHIRRALDVLPTTELINGYGPTESTTFACSFSIPRPLDTVLRSIPIGRPIANTQGYVLDGQLHPVPIGVPGELYIGGDGLARGYLHRPELTAERFIPHPWSSEPGARLYKTGDLVRWLPDGTIEYLGRLDDQVKIRGFRVEPGEVAAVLGQHPGVAESLVVAVDVAPGEKRLAAYIVPQGQAETLAPEALRAYLRDRLPEYMVPAAFVCLERFPVTPVGKVDRRALPAPVWHERSADQSADVPGTETERWLAAIWRDLLHVEVGATDNFFTLGGHSLLATRLIARISSELGTTLPIRWLFDYPTVAELAAAIEQAFPGTPPHTEAQAGHADEDRSLVRSASGKATWPVPTAEGVTLETRPLLSLIAAGALPPVDAVALGYVSEDPCSAQRCPAIKDVLQGLPVLTSVLSTPCGQVGVITLPLTSQELYAEQEHLVRLCTQARTMAKAMGARALALTGLLPSATAYGQALLDNGNQADDVRITTGHATTTASIVLNLKRLLHEAGRKLSEERVAFLGLGSVGAATLRLMLSCLPHPAELLLCDLYTKTLELEALQQEVIGSLGYSGEVHLLSAAELTLPERLYTASVVIGATNVPDVFDISRAQPGLLCLDDSGPHCFDVERAIERFQARGDILFTEGGALLSPVPIRETVYAPDEWVKAAGEVTPLLASWHHEHLMGCVLSSLLSAREEVPPTIGLVNLEASRLHLQRLQALGFQAAPLHCEGYRLPDELIAAFRQRYGRQAVHAAGSARSKSHDHFIPC